MLLFNDALDQLELAILVWLLAGIKQIYRSCQLRAKNFKAAIDAVLVRVNRVRDKIGVEHFQA